MIIIKIHLILANVMVMIGIWISTGITDGKREDWQCQMLCFPLDFHYWR